MTHTVIPDDSYMLNFFDRQQQLLEIYRVNQGYRCVWDDSRGLVDRGFYLPSDTRLLTDAALVEPGHTAWDMCAALDMACEMGVSPPDTVISLLKEIARDQA